MDMEVDMRRLCYCYQKKIGGNWHVQYHSRESQNIRISVKLLISEFRGILHNLMQIPKAKNSNGISYQWNSLGILYLKWRYIIIMHQVLLQNCHCICSGVWGKIIVPVPVYQTMVHNNSASSSAATNWRRYFKYSGKIGSIFYDTGSGAQRSGIIMCRRLR